MSPQKESCAAKASESVWQPQIPDKVISAKGQGGQTKSRGLLYRLFGDLDVVEKEIHSDYPVDAVDVVDAGQSAHDAVEVGVVKCDEGGGVWGRLFEVEAVVE